MPTSQGCAVRDLLPSRFRNIDEAVRHEMLRDPDFEEARLPGFALGFIGEKATDALGAALDCDVFGLLARAWAKARELHDYTDAAKHPPDAVSTLFLGEHTLTSDVHPVVEVAVGLIGRFSLRFDLELAATVRAVALTIRDKHIIQMGNGDLSASARLSYDGVPLHDPLTSKDLKLAGAIDLPRPGLAIF